jgi:hypothetical protein
LLAASFDYLVGAGEQGIERFDLIQGHQAASFVYRLASTSPPLKMAGRAE